MTIPRLLWFWSAWTGQFEAIELTDDASCRRHADRWGAGCR